MESPVLLPTAEGQVGDLIKPFLSPDGAHFAQDFWMRDRMAAMAGASVAEYGLWNLALGMRGAFGTVEGGRKPAHLFVLKPDDPSDGGVMTSPGTPDCGWMPAGASYIYDPSLRNLNFLIWCRAGAPKWNDYGDWSQSGVPLAYVQETWRGVNERNLNQPGWPGTGRKRR